MKRFIQRAVVLCAIIIFFAAVAAFVLPLIFAFIPTASASSAKAISLKQLCKVSLFTLLQATLSAFIALAVGLCAAYFVSHKNFAFRKILAATSAVPLSIPPLIIALGYVGFFGMNGGLNRAFSALFHTDKKLVTFLYSFKGIIIAQGFYNFPLVMSTIADTWAHLLKEQSEAAEILGASKLRIFFTITLHQLSSCIISSLIPVFLYCFFSFLIVLLFGGVGTSTLEVELYQAARSSLDMSSASSIALTETLIAIAFVFLYSSFERKIAGKKAEISALEQKRVRITGVERAVAFPFFLLIILFFASPLFCIAFSAFPHFSLSVVKKIIASKGFRTALVHTIQTGIMTSFFCVVVAFVYAVFLRIASKKDSTLLKTLPILPMAVSSVVMGFGITRAVQNGTVALLIASQTALIFPLAFRQLWASIEKISSEALDVAAMLSPHKTDTIFYIYLKSSKRAIISSFILCFASSAGDTTLPLVLAIPHYDTLALYTYRLASSYRYAQASASGLLLGILCIALFALGNFIKEKK